MSFNRIGRYRGIPCYKCDMHEYINARKYENVEDIFIINGELIYKNEIIGKYDGNYVTDYEPWEVAPYYTIPKFERKEETKNSFETRDSQTASGGTQRKSENSTQTAEIDLSEIYGVDYSRYTEDVDNFFCLLLEIRSRNKRRRKRKE